MQGADIAIGVLALVSVVGSVVGVVTYEPDSMPTWEISILTETVDTPEVAASMSVQGAQQPERTWDLDRMNVTRVAFEVVATGGAARIQPTTVEVTITPPNGDEQVQSLTLQAPNSNSATATVAFEDLAPLPQGGTTQNATSEEARATVPTSANATGEWMFSARITTAGVPPETVQIEVTMVELTYYTASVRVEGTDLGEAV